MARRANPNRRRDPNAPKKGRSAWQMFFADNREDVAKQNPNLNNQEIMKKLGEMWRQSDDGTKRRYHKQYQSSQVEYEQKLSAYKEEQKNKRSQSSNSKSNNNNSGQSKKGNQKNSEETNDYNSSNQS